MQAAEFKSEMLSIMYQLKAYMQKFIEPILQAEGLNMLQSYILFRLSEVSNTNISSLSKEFSINQGNVSTICKQMEKDGLIIRSRSSKDERIVTLSLTEEGKIKVQKLKSKADEYDAVFEQIPSEKLEIIIKGMNEYVNLLKILSTKND